MGRRNRGSACACADRGDRQEGAPAASRATGIQALKLNYPVPLTAESPGCSARRGPRLARTEAEAVPEHTGNKAWPCGF